MKKIKQSQWQWKGSSLDPTFRRPKVSLKRKRERSSESSSSAESKSQGFSDQEDLFPEEAQVKHIARKCPGLFARYALIRSPQALVDGVRLGEEDQEAGPRAVFVKYYRQVFANSGASAPMKREYLTLAMCLDSIIEGNILKCLDVGVQRLKAVEQISQGVMPSRANRLELILPEISALASTEESRTAATEHRREEKVRATWKGKARGPRGAGRSRRKAVGRIISQKDRTKGERAERERSTRGSRGGDSRE